jgi:hypothetical protein
MSSDGNNDLTYEYPAGAVADSPIPLSQEHPINTPVSVPIPIVNFTTMQPLNVNAPVFGPRPVTASSSASDVAALFRGLRVHIPAPLTPDGQHAAHQINETIAVSFTPAEGRGGQASLSLESGAATRSEATLGAATTTAGRQRANSNGSATTSDLRQCARCGEQNQYCHGHTPVIPNPSLDLPPSQPRVPVQRCVLANGVARFNLNRAQATSLAACILDALEDNKDAIPIPPPYNYGQEIANIVAEGLGIDPGVAAEGLGVRGRGRARRGEGQGGRPHPVPDAGHPANPQQAQGRQAARRPVSPTPPGFEHNRGPAYVPFHIQENGRETPAHYVRVHLEAPNPFVEGRLSLDGPTYHSEIHAQAIHDVDIPPPPITANILRLLHTDYMGHDRIDEALGEIGDWSLITDSSASISPSRSLSRTSRTSCSCATSSDACASVGWRRHGQWYVYRARCSKTNKCFDYLHGRLNKGVYPEKGMIVTLR